MAQLTFGPEITERAFNENIKHIISDPFNAVIEIISNSWDSGAEEVLITWPDEREEMVVIEDNGEGMTEEEFREIWPKISYNRLDFKDKEVKFRRQREGYREAYGQHGKGRHSPFSFGNSYIVETWKDGNLSKFKIKKDHKTGFEVERLGTEPKEDSGTKISFKVYENYRGPEKIKEAIGTRFLTDPSFRIIINGEEIKLDDLEDFIEEFECEVDNETVKILKIQSGERSRNTHFHGVTWVIGKRRIKNTAWADLLDGRTGPARDFAYVVHSDLLKDDLNENMSDFKKNERTERFQNNIKACIRKSVAEIMASERNEVKKEIIMENIVNVKEMGSSDQDDVGTFISVLQTKRTAIQPIDLKAAAETFIKITESKSGAKFLRQLSKFDHEDIDNITKILDTWSVKEARIVLDLIHQRLKLLEELELKANNPQTKELEELQPLFEVGLWIFGPEFESIEFTSNKALSTVVRDLLKKQGIGAKESKLRPDFVVLPESTIGIHSCDKFDDDNEATYIDKILFLELKRGGSRINVQEKSQVENYINILIKKGAISNETRIDAYVLGTTVECELSYIGESRDKRIIPLPYHRILKRAELRLFNLRKKIEEAKNIKDEPTDPTIREALAQTTIQDYQ